MVLIGRLTKDAVIATTKDERKVVNFGLVINDGYTKRGTNEWVSIPTFYNCAYWLNSGIANILKKGNLVEITGRVSVKPYNDLQGEAKATLNLHVDSIKVHFNKKDETPKEKVIASGEKDDLPF